MAKNTPRKDLMERELLDHAVQLFARSGYGGTSLREIADTAGVGRTTLYHYFSSKEDFLSALVEDVTLSAWSKLSSIRGNAELSPRAQLEQAVHMLVLHVLENPLRFRVLERDEENLPEELARRHKKAKRDALQEIVGIIEAGISAGEFNLVDAHTAGLTVFGMCNWPAWWYSPSGPKAARDVVETISKMALAALVKAEKGAATSPSQMIENIRNDLGVLAHMIER